MLSWDWENTLTATIKAVVNIKKINFITLCFTSLMTIAYVYKGRRIWVAVSTDCKKSTSRVRNITYNSSSRIRKVPFASERFGFNSQQVISSFKTKPWMPLFYRIHVLHFLERNSGKKNRIYCNVLHGVCVLAHPVYGVLKH
jgi:hypothetical protein